MQRRVLPPVGCGARLDEGRGAHLRRSNGWGEAIRRFAPSSVHLGFAMSELSVDSGMSISGGVSSGARMLTNGITSLEVSLSAGATGARPTTRRSASSCRWTFETLTDVGDEAYLEDFNLFFRAGTRWHALCLVRLDDFAAYREPLIELAKQTVAKW